MKIFEKVSLAIDKFWNGKYFIPFNILLTAICMATGNAFLCFCLLTVECLIFLVFSDDIMILVFPLFAFLLVSTNYYKDLSVLVPYMMYAIVPGSIAMIFHLVYYRRPFVKGRFLYPTLSVAVALLLGGIGVISKNDYFLGINLYYVIALGLGMAAVYCVAMSRLQNERSYDRAERLSLIIYSAGILCVLLLAVFYIQNIHKFLEKGGVLFYKPRNYLCTVIFLAMPQCCRYIKKNNLHILVLAAMYITMILSGSRSGLLIGTIMLVVCIVYVYLTNKKSRKLYNVLLIIIGILAAVAALKFAPQIYSYLYDYRADEFDGKLISKNETRVKYILLGLNDFKQYPIFGIGLGNRVHKEVFKAFFPGSLIFYHNCVIQIIASMGIVGIAAYLWQFITRIKLMWQTRNSELIMFSLSYIGIIMMSLVNPGIFSPFPNLAIVTIMFAVMEHEFCKQNERNSELG